MTFGRLLSFCNAASFASFSSSIEIFDRGVGRFFRTPGIRTSAGEGSSCVSTLIDVAVTGVGVVPLPELAALVGPRPEPPPPPPLRLELEDEGDGDGDDTDDEDEDEDEECTGVEGVVGCSRQTHTHERLFVFRDKNDDAR